MPAGQGEQLLAPAAAKEPIAHITQLGCTPPDHDQLLSVTLFVSEDGAPAKPAAHEKEYEEVPAAGEDGVATTFGKALSGGCDSATTSAVERARE